VRIKPVTKKKILKSDALIIIWGAPVEMQLYLEVFYCFYAHPHPRQFLPSPFQIKTNHVFSRSMKVRSMWMPGVDAVASTHPHAVTC